MNVPSLLLEHRQTADGMANNEWDRIALGVETGKIGSCTLVHRTWRRRDDSGQLNRASPPLDGASERGEVDSARLLLECGADVTAQDKHGRTPFHRTSEWGLRPVAQTVYRMLDDGVIVISSRGLYVFMTLYKINERTPTSTFQKP
jgi:hypothetical protein